MSLDKRVRSTLLDFKAGRCDVEAAAARLLEVRRETGCLQLHAAVVASERERQLVARVAQLLHDEFGE